MKKVLECSIFIDFYFLIQLYNETIYYLTTHQCIQFLQKMYISVKINSNFYISSSLKVNNVHVYKMDFLKDFFCF